MDHRLKTFTFKALSLLPKGAGMRLYHSIQNLANNRNLPGKIKSNEATYNQLLTLCAKVGIDLSDKRIIEIGSGWIPMMPYLLVKKAKARAVHTYDLNHHYQRENIRKLNAAFFDTYGVSIDAVGSYGLPENVKYYPSTNLIHAPLPEAELVLSRFVLEHVTPKDMAEMHQKFKKDLPKGSYIIHFISPSDHRAYTDKNLSLQDFLKYSQEEWDAIQTDFDYHNRMRLPQYLRLFEDAGLELVTLTYAGVKEGSEQQRKFRELTVHEDFRNYSEEELTAGGINVILKT